MALTIQSKAFGMQKYAFSMRKHKENMLFKVFFAAVDARQCQGGDGGL